MAFGEGSESVHCSEAHRMAARTVGSHKIMKKEGWADYPFSFHDSEELGPAILAKVVKRTGLKPKDL